MDVQIPFFFFLVHFKEFLTMLSGVQCSFLKLETAVEKTLEKSHHKKLSITSHDLSQKTVGLKDILSFNA